MVVYFRSLLRNKFFSAINIFGLAVAMAIFMLIAEYVKFETSYEDFVPNASSIYRVTLETYINHEMVTASAENYGAVGPAMLALPEVTGYARLYNLGYKNNVIITNEEAKPQPIAIKQRKFLYADSAYLPMFGYHLESGNAQTALSEPNSAVITREYARSYFGAADPVGKTLHMRDDDNNDEWVKVTGVVSEIPDNTHLKFDILFSYKTLMARKGKNPNYALIRFEGWQRSEVYTFVQVRQGTDPKALEAKLPAIVLQRKANSKELQREDILHLQPLSQIHLTSRLAEEFEENGDRRIVRFLGYIGLFVLAIGWINYINLSTAKAMERAREVGVRKVLGAVRLQLIRQFLFEGAIVNLLSIVLAFVIAETSLPAFNSLAGLTLNMGHFFQPWFLGLVALLWVAGTLCSGFYPAIVLSSFRPAQVLKGKLKNSSRGVLLRKSLVVFQFIASVALISGTLIIYRQLEYMTSQNVGMNIEQVLVLQRPGIEPPRNGTKSMDFFRQEVLKNTSIEAVTGSSTIPGMQREYKDMVKRYGASDDREVSVRLNSMDYSFMDVFQMKLLAGRVFSEAYAHDGGDGVVITESASKILGFKNPQDAIGQTVSFPNDWNPKVVGVVNDYHQVSFKDPLEPTVFYCDIYEGEYYSMRIHGGNLPATIDHVRAAWQTAFPGNPFEYFFLDQYFDRQYRNERQFGQLFSTFAALALTIGCLGLFGLSAYTATQRTKEIGIRKVLGSSEASLFLLLSKDYIQLILLSIFLGMPLIYLIMDQWLQSFPYRTTITASIFIVSGAAVLVISLLTVSVQIFRASRANPVDSLKYE